MIRHPRLAAHPRKSLGSLLLATLLILQQGLSMVAAADDVAQTPKAIVTPVNLGGAANLRTAPVVNNLPVSGTRLGVDVSIPTLGEVSTNGAVQGAQLEVPGAEGAALKGASLQDPEAAKLSAPASIVAPVASVEKGPETGAPKAEQAVAAQTSALSSELSKPEAKSGSRFSLFTRFFDRRAKSSDSNLTPVAAPPIAYGDRHRASGTLRGAGPKQTARRKFVEFNVQYLRDIKSIFNESKVRPNKQDYIYLATKTWGVNLVVRAAFAIKGVHAGQLGLLRAILSTGWYQIQDSVFTVFGQTYMRFLGRMTGMFRIGNAKLGDLLFVYVQLVASEFMNRLVLGPLGENPLVYSWHGIGLLLLNNLQGMISGGLIVPVINKMKAAGLISEKTANTFYQLSSLTMHLGLLATFGYQHLFTVITTIMMVLSWAAYIGFSFFLKDKTPVQGGGGL